MIRDFLEFVRLRQLNRDILPLRRLKCQRWTLGCRHLGRSAAMYDLAQS